jgi:uncharacterized protein YkwD
MDKFALFFLSFSLAFGSLTGCMQPSKGESSRRSGAVGTEKDKKTDPKKKDDKKSDVILEDGPQEDADDDQKDDDKKDENTDCYKADQSICDMEREIWTLTNELRQQNGLQPLKLSPEMSWAARQWSDRMGDMGSISHAGFPGSRERDYQKEFGSSAGMSAENVAMTFTGASDVAREFYEMWENSSGHRANMLSRNGTIGIGVSQNSRGGWYATQIFGR